MERKLALIQAFSDGGWHSGEDLAQTLGISRAAVWKRLKSLEAYGLQFESRVGKGYRLSQSIELLEKQRLEKLLGEVQREQLAEIILLSETDSTNRYLHALAEQGEVQTPAICFAEYQSAGRGRRGRKWQSPFGVNIYGSFIWRFDEMPAELPALSLAVGVSVVEALTTLGLGDVGLKWPNDLLSAGKKLGGILIEHSGESGGPCRVIVGVGLNYAMSAAQAEEVDQPWTSLEAVSKSKGVQLAGRNEVAAALTRGLLDCLTEFSEQGFAPFRLRWPEYDIAQGKPVRVEHQGAWQEGEGMGIDKDGAMLVRIRGERQRFVSGDVSLRVEGAA